MNALMEGFAYTWLVVNPANGQTIADEDAIDTLTELLHHGLAGLVSSGGGGSSAPSRSSRSAHSIRVSRE